MSSMGVTTKMSESFLIDDEFGVEHIYIWPKNAWVGG